MTKKAGKMSFRDTEVEKYDEWKYDEGAIDSIEIYIEIGILE